MRVPHRDKARHQQWMVSRTLLIFNNQAINSASEFIYNNSKPTLTVNTAAFIFSVQSHVQFHLNRPVEMVCQRLIVRAVVQHSTSRHSKNPPQAGYFFLPARYFRCVASFIWPICRVIHQSCVPAYLLIISYSFLSCDILCSLTPPAPLPPSLFSAYFSFVSPGRTFHFLFMFAH